MGNFDAIQRNILHFDMIFFACFIVLNLLSLVLKVTNNDLLGIDPLKLHQNVVKFVNSGNILFTKIVTFHNSHIYIMHGFTRFHTNCPTNEKIKV